MFGGGGAADRQLRQRQAAAGSCCFPASAHANAMTQARVAVPSLPAHSQTATPVPGAPHTRDTPASLLNLARLLAMPPGVGVVVCWELSPTCTPRKGAVPPAPCEPRPLIVAAGRMRELVDSFAQTSKSMLVLKAEGKKWAPRKGREGKDLAIWEIGAQSSGVGNGGNVRPGHMRTLSLS